VAVEVMPITLPTPTAMGTRRTHTLITGPMRMAMPIDRTPTARTPMAGMAHVFGGDGVADGDNEARFLLNPLQPA
jgi:hypothetical protein